MSKNKFIAGGQGTNSMAYSNDGNTWVGLGNTIFTANGNGIVWTGSRFLALGRGINNTISFSSDGLTWTGLGNTIFNIGNRLLVNGNFILGSGRTNVTTFIGGEPSGINSKIVIGIDPIYGTTQTTNNFFQLSSSPFSTEFAGIQYTRTVSGDFWVGVGYGGNTIAYSFNATQWIGLGQTILNVYGFGIAYDGNNMWVAAGGNTNTLAYSTNGTQ